MTQPIDTIKTVLAYETADGQKFHDKADAQTHTRRRLFDGLYLHAAREDVEFAALPREQMVDWLMRFADKVAKVNALTLTPEPLPAADPYAGAAKAAGLVTPMRPGASIPNRVEVSTRPAEERRPTAHNPAFSAPYGGASRLQTAIQAVDQKELDDSLVADMNAAIEKDRRA